MSIKKVACASKSPLAKKSAAKAPKKTVNAAGRPRATAAQADHQQIMKMLDELRTDGAALAARVDQLRQRFS
jgi:hypothetical protein